MTTDVPRSRLKRVEFTLPVEMIAALDQLAAEWEAKHGKRRGGRQRSIVTREVIAKGLVAAHEARSEQRAK